MIAARGPFSAVTGPARKWALVALGISQAALTAEMLLLEWGMLRTGGPGIIPFEFAGTPERANRIIVRWGVDGRRFARRSLLMDYPYLANYSALHALACTTAADSLRDRGHQKRAALGPAVAWGQLAAGGFDMIENAALLAVLAGHHRIPARIAQASATVKFALLIAGWSYLLSAMAAPDRDPTPAGHTTNRTAIPRELATTTITPVDA